MNWKYINNQKTKIFKQECQKKELYFNCEKKWSKQKIQISTESNTEINENMSKSNYNNRNMQTRMILENDMSATSFKTEYS